MIDPIFVFSRIQFDVAAAIKAANGRLHIDDALIIAGTPCVLVDFANVPDRKLKYIAELCGISLDETLVIRSLLNKLLKKVCVKTGCLILILRKNVRCYLILR